MPSHTISVLVENEFGVLARVAGLFSGRGFNIESLTVNEDPLDPPVSRIGLVTTVTGELAGDREKIQAFLPIVRPLGIKEVLPSGKVAMGSAVQLNHDNHQGRQ